VRRPVEAPLAFRAAREEDLERIAEIESAGFAHPWSRELLARELGHAWSRVLLAVVPAESGERVVGFVVFWLVHDELHVLNIATAVEARGHGIGRALMEEAEEDARRRGARLATLEVRRSNTHAISLYRSLGYRQTGVRPRYYAEESEDAIVMMKDLG
jgi:ribosomal-protein-alanine N-acetyltransferase